MIKQLIMRYQKRSNNKSGQRHLRVTAAIMIILITYLNIHAGTGAAASAAVPDTTSVTSPTSVTSDSISLQPGYTDLDDLVVTATRKLVQSDGAKLTYNVNEDPEASSSNILDILRKVPGVTVDAEENVRVNGQSSFRILKNGREDPMFNGSDIKNILKSLPAATIKKIEVISEPGAKYDAEGAGGILNIVTDRTTSLSGFTTQLNGWVNAYQAGGSLNGRVKINKVMLDATVTYNNGKLFPRSQTSTSTEEVLTGPSAGNHSIRERKGYGGWDYTGGNINMSWEPDTLNLFTLSANYGYNTWGGPWEDHRTQFDADANVLWYLHRHTDDKGRWNGVGTQASYQHSFGRNDHNIVASYLFNCGGNKSHSFFYNLETAGDISDYPFERQNSDSWYTMHIMQLDYTNRFNSHHLLDAGFKGSIDREGNNRMGYHGQSEASAVADITSAVNLRQFKDIYALYLSYTGTFGKLNAKAGLRYEFTSMGLRYAKGDFPDFSSHLHDLVPNLALSWNFSPASALRFAYQMRINRPDIWYMNPFREYTTPGWVIYGNPDLKSQKSHDLSLGYTNYDHKFTGGAKLSWQYMANGITDIIFMKDGLINKTYDNIGTRHRLSLDLNFTWNITNTFNWSTYATGAWNLYHTSSEMLSATKAGWSANLSTNISYTLPCKVRLSAYGGFNTPWFDIQTEGTRISYWYGIGAGRSFLKDDALTLQVGASNFLPWIKSSGWRQVSESVIWQQTSRWKAWNFSLSLSFRFGALKASVKRTAAKIEQNNPSAQQGGKN